MSYPQGIPDHGCHGDCDHVDVIAPLIARAERAEACVKETRQD